MFLSPAMALSSVLFPAPLAPTRPTCFDGGGGGKQTSAAACETGCLPGGGGGVQPPTVNVPQAYNSFEQCALASTIGTN